MVRKNKNGAHFQPDYAVPPGNTLLEVMQEHGLDQTKLAAMAGLSPQNIHAIVQGEASLTAETAVRLEAVLGLPASFWNNLEAHYQASCRIIDPVR